MRLAAAILCIATLCSCSASSVTLEYTLPSRARLPSSCDPDSLRPLTVRGMALLYGRALSEPSWQFLSAHDLAPEQWGGRDLFVLNLRSVEWIMRVVTAVGDSVSCPSNEVYKDARKGGR